ncbi:DUF397 domain-containing protein [Kitasatospora aureofaciens]|uniref:DUF397 domain-containing protein n=1 Tax=Kitasatospora aureofaciens TaxID=1894 RepID=UPI0038172399
MSDQEETAMNTTTTVGTTTVGTATGSAVWRKSTHSGGSDGCIEVADGTTAVTGILPVRDSKDPNGPVLHFPSPAWRAFVTAVRARGLRRPNATPITPGAEAKKSPPPQGGWQNSPGSFSSRTTTRQRPRRQAFTTAVHAR